MPRIIWKERRYFIVKFVTFDCSTSHNKITRMHCNTLPVIIDSFGMTSSSIINKDLQYDRSKIAIGIY